MTSTPGMDRANTNAHDSTTEVAVKVLRGLAAASLAVALAAFGVMLMAYAVSSDVDELRDWPDGIHGWLVCIPALAASAILAIQAHWMVNPQPPVQPDEEGR